MAQCIERNAQNSICITQADGVKDIEFVGIAHDVAEAPRSIGQIIRQAIVTMSGYRGTNQLVFFGPLNKIPHPHLSRGKPSKKSNARISARNLSAG